MIDALALILAQGERDAQAAQAHGIGVALPHMGRLLQGAVPRGRHPVGGMIGRVVFCLAEIAAV